MNAELSAEQVEAIYRALNRDGFDRLIADQTIATVAAMLAQVKAEYRKRIEAELRQVEAVGHATASGLVGRHWVTGHIRDALDRAEVSP